jgi:hypothetical protein
MRRTITRAEILTIRSDALSTGRWPDQSMVDCCNVCLWDLDGSGLLIAGHYSANADRVRAAIDARLRTGEMYAHA